MHTANATPPPLPVTSPPSTSGQVASAIGGAIDRATLALLWLGRDVSVVTTLGALYCVGVSVYTWWTMPQEWPANFAPSKYETSAGFPAGIKKTDGQHVYNPFTLELARRTANANQTKINELLGIALLSFVACSIFLGLTRVMRWIVTGK